MDSKMIAVAALVIGAGAGFFIGKGNKEVVEVEKIVEKPVVEEKIVYQKVEIPKEIVKKEIVHVPLWTQDPDLITHKIEIPETETKPKKKK